MKIFKNLPNSSRYVVIFSHPADFTPVCTTELGKIAVYSPEFEKRNVKLLALSVDKLDDHVEWVNVMNPKIHDNMRNLKTSILQDIKSYCKDIPGDFPYPIIADPERNLAVQLGMIDEKSKEDPSLAMTIRALYVIGPDHRVRLTMHYPTSTGRNVK